MLKRIMFITALVSLLLPVATVSTADNGAENMELYGGSRGKVPFPHRTHQAVLGDCNKCHDLFPRQTGAIERLKKAGDLKKKQVMNKSCVKCHKTMKKAGSQTGPTTCSRCHIRG